MERKQFYVLVVLTIVFGLIGGALSGWFFNRHIATQELTMTGTEESYVEKLSISVDGSRVLEMPFGTVEFNPPYWTVEYNPTLDEARRLDKVVEKLKDPSIGDGERNTLIAEKESIIEGAQRPTKYISGSVVSKGTDAAIPTDIGWYDLYEGKVEKTGKVHRNGL